MNSEPAKPDEELAAKISRAQVELKWSAALAIATFFLSERLVRWHITKVGLYVACVALGVISFAVLKYLELRKLDRKNNQSRWIFVWFIAAIVLYVTNVLMALFKST